MQQLKTPQAGVHNFMDYTHVPAGWLIRGQLWTGQSTKSTVVCPKCGRIGLLSSLEGHQRVVVHTGRIDDNTLVGIDYCEIGFVAAHPN